MKKIQEIISQAFKEFELLVILMLALFALSFTGHAADTYNVNGGVPVISSIGQTSTNGIFGPTTNNAVWPSYIGAGQSVTNVTKIDTSGKSQVTFELDFQSTANLGATTTNIIIHLGRNVSASSPTNYAGTGCKIEWFATITNQLPASATANTTYTTHASFGEATGYSSGAFEGGCKAFYVGWIDAPANVTLTNYQIYVGTQ